MIDYDTEFKQDAQDAIYAPDQYRSADHDAVVVGLALDQTPPVVAAELDRITATRNTGLFVVDFSCVDNVDPDPECVADLNGVPVTDGQITHLVKAPGQPITLRLGPVLFMKDDSFTLTVTGTDERGNSTTATAEPVFGG